MKRQLLFVLLVLFSITSAKAQPISGTLSVCTGRTTALSHDTPGGSWSSRNTTIATIDEAGVVTGASVGTVEISYITDVAVYVASVTVKGSPAAITGTPLVCISGNVYLRDNTFSGTWSSSNPDVITVEPSPVSSFSRSLVTGMAAGSATVSYTLANGCYATYDIEVPAILETPITSPYDFKVCEGSPLALSNATTGGTWSSNDAWVGSVHEHTGVVSGGHLDGGPARQIFISYVTNIESTKQCAVQAFTITPLVRVFYVTEVCVGSSITFVPDSLGGTWSSSNPSALYINSSGEATGVMPVVGGANITYQLTNHPNCMFNAARSSPTIQVTNPPAISGDLDICIGQVSVLTTGIAGTWSSSVSSVATIGSSTGLLTGVSAGTSTIKFTKSLGCYTTATATVNGVPAAITGTLSVCAGGTRALSSATIGGTWESSNTLAATISATGVVTGIAPGTAVITYTAPTGCITTAIFTVNAFPTATPYYDALVCTGGTLRLYAGDEGGSTYVWTGPSSFTSALRNPTRSPMTAAMNGSYSVVVTSAGGCAVVRTLSVSVTSTAPYTVSVTQTAPFTITGETAHTYGAGFKLQADASITLPGTGVTYYWNGPGAVSTQTFAPTFSSAAAVAYKIYSVSITYNGCSAWKKDTIVVPATGCSPYNYFSVSNYRTAKGLPALSGCSDCSTVQPFHTISGYYLTSANVVDGGNYYLTNNQAIVSTKAELKDNNFFMAADTKIFVDSGASLTIDHCHFASGCGWVGIIAKQGVNATAHLKIIGNTLIEDAYGSSYQGMSYAGVSAWPTPNGGGYYSPEMADVLESNGVIYNKNSAGIMIYGYKPSMSVCPAGTKLPFTIRNSIFSRVELAGKDNGTTAADNYPFKWPTAKALRNVVSVTNDIPKFELNTYKVNAALMSSGIGVSNVGTSNLVSSGTTDSPALYEYNYLHIGANSPDENFDNTNLFDSLHIAVTTGYSNVKLFNNDYRNITNIANNAYGRYNDLRIEGEYGDNTNNRYYYCSFGLRMDGDPVNGDVWDITVRNAIFRSSGGYYGILENAHGYYNFINNYLVNANFGQGNSGSATKKGFTTFRGNTIIGKTSTGSSGSVGVAISVGDAVSTSANGTIVIDSNVITGAAVAINANNSLQRTYITRNKIMLYPYNNPPGNIVAGLTVGGAGIKEVMYNTVTGTGYKCAGAPGPYLTGMRLGPLGTTAEKTNVSCNLVEEVGYAFNFAGTSYVNWHNNEMRRDQVGLYLNPQTSIGQQGSACEPTDNRWTGDSCTGSCTACDQWPGWSGSGVYATATSQSMTPTTSKIYVRDEPTFRPITAIGWSGGIKYAWGTTVLNANTGSCDPWPAYSSCIPGAAARQAANEHEEAGTIAEVTIGNMRIFPNPTQGGVTIEMPDAADGTVSVRLVNAVGAEVYNNTHTFSSDRINLDLQQLPAGMYIVQLRGDGGRINTGRIVVVK